MDFYRAEYSPGQKPLPIRAYSHILTHNMPVTPSLPRPMVRQMRTFDLDSILQNDPSWMPPAGDVFLMPRIQDTGLYIASKMG